MNEESAKTKKEIGVGGYFGRVFALLGLIVVLAAGAWLAAGLAKGASGDLEDILHCVAVLCAIWAFPALCVDALNPRPILAATASFLSVAAAFGALTAACVFDLSAPTWLAKNIVWLVYLVYVVWLAVKLRNKKVCESARRLRWALFATVGVPAALGVFALASRYFSGASENMSKGEWIAWGIVVASVIRPYCFAAATFGVFAVSASLKRFKGKPEDEPKPSAGVETESV